LLKEPKLVVLFVISILLLCLQTPVFAVVLPPQADELQDLKISISTDSVGSLTQETDLSWSLSSELLGENLVYVDNPNFELIPNPDYDENDPNSEPYIIDPNNPPVISSIIPEPPLNPNGEVQSHVTYSEDTQANMGIISYKKDSEVNTAAQVLGLYNIQNERMITFTGIDAITSTGGTLGTLLSSEDMTMYNVGTCTPVLVTCPFSNCCCGLSPAFCSKIEVGSDLDMNQVAAHTSGSLRNVNEMGDLSTWPNVVPSADGPALANYFVQVTEMEQRKPSIGSVSAYLKISESDSSVDAPDPQKTVMQQLKVDELTSIKGSITLFEKQMNFESKYVGCNQTSVL